MPLDDTYRMKLKAQEEHCVLRNNRGVALIIVLLVTALLLALVFEFAYGTRVSLRAAENFRNSQRAYFVANSGIQYFIKSQEELRKIIPQGEWAVLPIVSAGDTEVRIKWEDEAGKIYIVGLRPQDTSPTSPYSWLVELFRIQNVSQDIVDHIVEASTQFRLLSELHKLMGDDDYNKVAPFLTIYSGSQKSNINTAPEAVLKSVLATGKTTVSISSIISARNNQPYATLSGELNNYFIASSNVYRLYSYATVGNYTKQIEAVIDVTKPHIPLYWQVL